MKPSHTIRSVFDDPNLVSAAGLVPALRLAEAAGLYDLLEGLSVPSPNAAAKTAGVVGGYRPARTRLMISTPTAAPVIARARLHAYDNALVESQIGAYKTE